MLTIIHDAKLPKYFNIKLWKSGYNQDHIFVSTNIGGMCQKKVLDQIPHLQHRPISVSTTLVVISQPT